MTIFYEKVFKVVENIPYGKVMSYGQIARLIGFPRSARQVGWAMQHCPENLPWQRVIMSDGSVAGGFYADLRKNLLEKENVKFLPNGRVDLKIYQWDYENYANINDLL